MVSALLLPGFADSADYEGLVGLDERLMAAGVTVTRTDWPGVWSRASEGPYLFTRAVAEARAFAARNPGVHPGRP